jgi:hypothetical protein
MSSFAVSSDYCFFAVVVAWLCVILLRASCVTKGVERHRRTTCTWYCTDKYVPVGPTVRKCSEDLRIKMARNMPATIETVFWGPGETKIEIILVYTVEI